MLNIENFLSILAFSAGKRKYDIKVEEVHIDDNRPKL